MRDITLEDTFYMFFTTRAFATGIPTTLAGVTVSVYEENNTTQITSDVSITTDYDGISGLNMATIAATAANTYENGKGYALVVSMGTVDSVSVAGEVVGEFTIGASASAVDLANVTDGLSALKTLLDAIPTTAMRGTDSAVLATSVGFAGVGLTHLAQSSIVTEARLSELDGGNLPTDIDGLTTQIGTAGDGLTAIALPNQTMDISGSVTSVTGSVGSVSGHTPQTGDNYVRLGFAGVGLTHLAIASINTEARLSELDGGNLPTDIAAIPTTAMRGTDNAATSVEIGFAGVGLTHLAIATNLTTVNTVVDSILSLLDDPRSEPSQGALASNADAMTKLDYLYKLMRNKIITGPTQISIYDDAGTTVDHKSTISAVGSTFTRGEFVTGA